MCGLAGGHSFGRSPFGGLAHNHISLASENVSEVGAIVASSESWLQVFGAYVLDVLGEFGAARGDQVNEYVHFGLPAIFFGFLLFRVALRRITDPSPRETLLLYGVGFGLLREVFMFTVKSLEIQGLVQTATLELFFPPLEHLILSIARVLIAAAFILFLLESRKLTRWYLIIGSVSAVLVYGVTAAPWWAEVVADPDIRFGKFWGDKAFHAHSFLASAGVVLAILIVKDKPKLIWSVAFVMFALNDALMLFNLYTDEIYKAIIVPIRHNLHIWAIPLLGYLYTVELQEEAGKMKQQLVTSERERVIGQLAAGVAHDFNNILQAIRSFAELAEDSDKTDSESLEQITNATDRAAALIGQLLLFSRRERPETAETAVDETVRAVLPMVDRLIGPMVNIEMKLNSGGASVNMSESNLEQVLTNLVVNAVYAMPNGGTVMIETKPFDRKFKRDGNPEKWLRLSVTDTGTGMTPEQIERAFEPFFTTKPVGEGTGLGLATVYGVVTNLGGSISIDSVPKQGTSINIELPMSDPKNAVPKRTDDDTVIGAVPERGATILLVDPEFDILKPLSAVLERAGCVVIQASTYEEAISLLDSAEIAADICILELTLPTMTGYEFYDHILEKGFDIPAIFISGNAPEPDSKFRDCTHLYKPFDSASLLSAIRRIQDRVS